MSGCSQSISSHQTVVFCVSQPCEPLAKATRDSCRRGRGQPESMPQKSSNNAIVNPIETCEAFLPCGIQSCYRLWILTHKVLGAERDAVAAYVQ